MRRTKDDAKKTRQELLEAANRVFARKGYGATKLEEIAIESGVTRGAISWHFQNKQTIFRSLVRESSLEALTSVDSRLKRNGEPLEKLRQLIVYLVKDRHRKHYQVAMLSKLKEERPPEFLDLIEEIETIQGFIISSFQKLIDTGINAGHFISLADPEFLAKSIYTFFWGFFINHDTFYNEYTDNELVQYITNFFENLLGIQKASILNEEQS